MGWGLPQVAQMWPLSMSGLRELNSMDMPTVHLRYRKQTLALQFIGMGTA